MFKEINELYQSLQMKITNILILNSKLQAFQKVLFHGQKVLSKDVQTCLYALIMLFLKMRFNLVT
jgi:hypothetical protein